MSKKKTTCEKCKGVFYCDEHHILPKGIFGDGETEELCKNCHDEFHRNLGHKYLRKENEQPMEFYFHKYYKWLYLGVLIVAVYLFIQ